MEYAFEGIGPQPPETVIFNHGEFTPDQRRDAMAAYLPTHERIMKETRQRVAAIAGEYATQLAQAAVQKAIDLEGGRQVRIIDLPDSLPPETQEKNRNLDTGDPYTIEFPQDPKEIRQLADLIVTERHFPLSENVEYDIRSPQPTIEEGETGNEQ